MTEEINLRKYEDELINDGYEFICGVDEAGRGPLVGSVVAAAVILPKGYFIEGLTDSKKLTEAKRDYFYEIIKKDAIAIGVASVNSKTIDKINIYEASRLAMNNAIDKLSVNPDYILTDAMPLPTRDNVTSIIKGDALSITIGAASIIAKVTRDRQMKNLDKLYPMYGFKKHKGYGTKEHISNMKKYGIINSHRRSYKPVLEELNNNNLYVNNK